MHVIITLAGHSRRFKASGYDLPKFLIEINGKPMIEHVLDMFGHDDVFHFVINNKQVADNENVITYLKGLAPRTHITIIEPHEEGPVYSSLQVTNIPDDEEVIVSYCDFFVEWNYALFKRQVYGYDGAIPCFKGFHPASFGDTYYAYLRTNAKHEMLELREKNSFTDNRSEEFASAGIYYFKKWSVFVKYARELMHGGYENLQEGYVSLLYNPMVNDGLKVKITEIDKFICWGTPEDLNQYYYWCDYFDYQSVMMPQALEQLEQTNLIPMAGKGSRFKEYGYKISKPLIQVGEQPMIVKACLSFPPAQQNVFLARQEDLKKHAISNILDQTFSNNHIIEVDHDTSGQAATCLLAEDVIDKNNALFIASCDYEHLYNPNKWLEVVDDPTIDGAIWTYRIENIVAKNPEAFAYCKVKDGSNEIIEVVEKQTISNSPGKDPMVVGSFWFRKANDFFGMAHEAIAKDITVNGEHYIGNAINLLLQKGKKFVIFEVDKWVSFGDPFELLVYHYWEEHFYQHNKIALKKRM